MVGLDPGWHPGDAEGLPVLLRWHWEVAGLGGSRAGLGWEVKAFPRFLGLVLSHARLRSRSGTTPPWHVGNGLGNACGTNLCSQDPGTGLGSCCSAELPLPPVGTQGGVGQAPV